jgi:hypothetical protein
LPASFATPAADAVAGSAHLRQRRPCGGRSAANNVLIAALTSNALYPLRIVPLMDAAEPADTLTQRELIELWTVVFGEPPPVVHDPPLMLRLVEAQLLSARQSVSTGG